MNKVLKWQVPGAVEVTHHKNPFPSIQSDVDRLMNEFYEFFGQQKSHMGHLEAARLTPSLDIISNKEGMQLQFELPGLDKEEVKITVADGYLTIKADKSLSKVDKHDNYLVHEISHGYYERSIAIPNSVDIDKAKATFKKGILFIDIPKKIGSLKNVRMLKIEKEIRNKL